MYTVKVKAMCGYMSLVLIALYLMLISFTASSAQDLLQDLKCENEECARGLLFPDLNTIHSYDDASTPALIRRYGYPAETHSVLTDDGYILELHRIPHGKNRKADPQKKPVFLQHGIVTSSADWVLAGPNVSLALLLADKGYDVWLGNIRGNLYCRSHIKFSTQEYRFWNFSFHEMAMFDAPASIDYILSKSNQDKVTYIGHSMGNTIFYVMTAMRPEYNAKILVQLSLGPVAYFFHTTSPVKLVAPFAAELTKPPELLYHGELLSRSPLLNEVLRIFCTLNTVGMIFCLNLVFFLLGKDADQIKYSLIPSIVGHAPAGVSTKTLVHYSQFINRPNTFRQFDYGPLQNVQHYNSSVPPDYNVSAITAKVAFFYGPNDPLANEKDVKLFYPRLPNPIGLFRVNFSTFTHIDFLWAKDARAILYNQLLDLIDSETRKND